jgi:hypothetical protein
MTTDSENQNAHWGVIFLLWLVIIALIVGSISHFHRLNRIEKISSITTEKPATTATAEMEITIEVASDATTASKVADTVVRCLDQDGIHVLGVHVTPSSYR